MPKELKSYLLLSIVLPGLFLSSCAKIERSQKDVSPVKVVTQVITPQAYEASFHYVGTIEAAQETPLSMQSAGRVLAVNYKDGDYVRQGSVLLQIDSTLALNTYHSAEAALRQAKDGYERACQVYAKGAVTDQKMVEIESQLAQAEAFCQAAAKQLEECRLIAPCDGLLSGLNVQVGQTVVPGVRLCAILDVAAFSVRFTVPETEVGRVHLHQPGVMECAAADASSPIVVTEKSLKANPVAHTYEVTARIQGKTRTLMPGMIAKITLTSDTSDTTHQAQMVVVPARCICLMPDGPTIWMVHQAAAVRRPIIIDGYQADGVRVLSGIGFGDTIIVDGYQKLYQGCPIVE